MKMHVIASGSKGNASVIYNDTTVILVDMGITKIRLEEGLLEINKTIDDIDYVLFTHEHIDHIKGAVFFPKKKEYCRVGTLDVPLKNLLEIYREYRFKDIKVTVLLTSHDAISPCGFFFEDKTNNLVYLTDTGYIPDYTLKLITNKNYYFIEANHDVEMLLKSNRPKILKSRILSDVGHLSDEQSAKYMLLCVGDKTKGIMLAHLSEECNSPEIALKTYKDVFAEEGISLKKISLTCAKQYESRNFIL